MPERAVIGRPPNYRFKEAIFAGPVRSLEQWGAVTADDWAQAANIMDVNPNWPVQNVIQHLIWRRNPPVPVEPAADVPPPVEPATIVHHSQVPPALPVSNKRPLELSGPPPKRPHTLPDPAQKLAAEVRTLAFQVTQLAVEVKDQLLALAVPVPEQPPVPALPDGPEPDLAVEPEPVPEFTVEAPTVPGSLPGTYVLSPLPLWGARHNLARDAWASKVTALVKAYGPFPDRIVIIVSIRYSQGRDLSKEQYEACVQRCMEAASTLIRHIRSLEGQENRQFLIYPWIRSCISSTSNWFATVFQPTYFPRGIPRTTTPACRYRELEFVLDNLAPGTGVWWLSIGLDALTTDVENLRKVQIRWPTPDFTLAIMVHQTFSPNTADFGSEDICPPRPAASGMRIRIYSFAKLLTGAHNLGDAPVRKLLAVWQHISDGKQGRRRDYDKTLTMLRNTMPVSPGGLSAVSLPGARI